MALPDQPCHTACAERRGLRLVVALVCFLLPNMLLDGAFAQMAKIVGTGAIGCGGFNQAVDRNPENVREYFAWAQGYMSGVMIRAPSGVDDELDLSSNAMPVVDQILFLRRYCALHLERDYADAVGALYRALGGKGM